MVVLRALARSSARLSATPLNKPAFVAQPFRLGGIRLAHDAGHEAESYEAFNARYAKFFDSVDDLFELQRGLNNCFAYDLVPATNVVESALKASRRVNDFSTAVRIFEGLKEKVENKTQYAEYLKETEATRKELGLQTKEELYGLRD